MTEFPPRKRLNRLIWGLIVATGVVVLAAPVVSGFFLDWRTFTAPGCAVIVLLGAALFYGRYRPDPRLSSGLSGTAQLIAFTMVGAPLSYLAAAANLPLQDHLLDAADRAVGLDWRALLDWMNASHFIYALLHQIYQSLTVQMTTVVLCLAFTGRLLRLQTFVLAFILAALVTIFVSALLPAVGAWPYYGLTAAASPHVTPVASTSWPVFYGLRDGSFRALTAIGAQGIISFPSLHAALAVILVMAVWPVPILRWIILILNAAMLVATPIDGSHYFVDVFAGVALAVACYFAADRLAAAPAHDGIETGRSAMPARLALGD